MRGGMKCKHRACCHHSLSFLFAVERSRAMKVQQLAVGGFWEQQLQDPASSPSSFSFSSSSSSSTSTTSSLTVRFTRLRPLAPKLTATAIATTQTAATSLDRKGFHFPRTKCPAANPDSSQMEKPSGGTRWNPTPEQIRVLEALYRGGTRTPNAHQIECITAELGKYGRIEGKNVFYWFQNHKARERQKQKRSALLALSSSNNDSRSSNSNNYSSACSPLIMPLMTTTSRGGGGGGGAEECYDGTFKRTCRSWEGIGLDIMEEGGRDRTLDLFPLRPEGKKSIYS